jgi:hypothetical protein
MYFAGGRRVESGGGYFPRFGVATYGYGRYDIGFTGEPLTRTSK